ncbi:hypothetical protein K2X83_02975 [Patescibacteria group bacterium]|nr:hypothetical protein [Patescibacteria group bacterium]
MSLKIVGIIAAVLIVGGAAAFFVMNSSGNPGFPESGSDITTRVNQPGAYNGSLADLTRRGGDWQCTFTVENQVAQSSGTVYVSGQKLRGDFSSLVPQLNQTIDSHMIQDNGAVYVWTSLSPQGFKTETAISTPGGAAAFQEQGVDVNQAYDYNCVPWTVDPSKFELPAGVTFAGA